MAETSDQQRKTIREINSLVRALVEQETAGYGQWTGGIVTRCFVSDRGHVYFDLNDDGYSIACMVRETVRGKLDFKLSNNLEIEVFGSVYVYDKQARVQIDVQQVRLIERPPYIIDATLQEQLTQKGLWPKVKKPLPRKIETIGLITSKQSDALHDFEDTYRSEKGIGRVKLSDVRLQGQQAVHEIAEAITHLNREKAVDVIAIIRGGGRAADLAVFNDILIAEAICRSVVPVVTGLGHQRDNTFADQVADASAITPTAAAALIARAGQQAAGSEKAPAKINPAIYLFAGLLIVIMVTLLVFFLNGNAT